MAHMIVGVYDNAETAQRVVSALTAMGCDKDDISVFEPGQEAEAKKELIEGQKGFFQRIADDIGDWFGRDVSEEDQNQYIRAVREGNCVVAVKTSEPDRVEAQMNTFHPLELGPEGGLARSESEASASPTTEQAEETTIPVVEENLVAGKREVPTGRVRVHSRVTEEPASAEVNLRQEKVDVERVPADRPVQTSDAAFRDRTLEMQESAEEPVVGKEARVVEEVKLSKEEQERRERVEDTVRRTDVDVEKAPDVSGTPHQPPRP